MHGLTGSSAMRSPLVADPANFRRGLGGADGAPGAASLLGLVGATAAILLLTIVPEEESGRTVQASIDAAGNARVDHVSGRQYLRAYLDIAGIPTACDGITRGVRMGQTFTEEQCTAQLVEEIEIHARGALACAPSLARPGRDYQRAAAISLTFNIGIGGFCGSSARKAFEAGQMTYACDRFLPWNKARVRGGLRPVRGLTLRRQREREICLTGLTPDRTPANLRERMERFR